jgi:hypothetical protein
MNQVPLDHKFVSLKDAKDLQDLGFEEECIRVYDHFDRQAQSVASTHDQYPIQICLCPLKTQVFDWFRTKYNINSWIHTDGTGSYWNTVILDYKRTDSSRFDSYEEAENQLIKKLIKIKNER